MLSTTLPPPVNLFDHTSLSIMAAPVAMSERQLQKLLAQGKFPEVAEKEDVKSGSKSKKGRGKSATSIPLPEDEETTSAMPEDSTESKGATKPTTSGRGKAKTDAKGKRKMDDDNDNDDVVVTTTFTPPTPMIGSKIAIVCCSTINYLLRWIDEDWICSSWNQNLLHFILIVCFVFLFLTL